MDWFIRIFRNHHAEAAEAEKMERLAVAQAELRELQQRGDTAVRYLVERGGRNHWRESIENMIQGVS